MLRSTVTGGLRRVPPGPTAALACYGGALARASAPAAVPAARMRENPRSGRGEWYLVCEFAVGEARADDYRDGFPDVYLDSGSDSKRRGGNGAEAGAGHTGRGVEIYLVSAHG